MEKRKQESGYHVRKLLIAHLLLLTPFASARGFTKKKKFSEIRNAAATSTWTRPQESHPMLAPLHETRGCEPFD
jgi:hypothetical protein